MISVAQFFGDTGILHLATLYFFRVKVNVSIGLGYAKVLLSCCVGCVLISLTVEQTSRKKTMSVNIAKRMRPFFTGSPQLSLTADILQIFFLQTAK